MKIVGGIFGRAEKEREEKKMTIATIGNLKVLAKNETPSRDGKSMFYNIAVLTGGEAGNISCTEDVYKDAVPDAVNTVTFLYNDNYKSFRAIAAKLASQSGDTPKK